MKLAYEAMDSHGVTRRDVVEVSSREEAMDRIRREGLFVTKLASAEEDAPVESGHNKGGVWHRLASAAGSKHKHLILFSRQMSMLMGVGTGVVPALAALAQQMENEKWREILQRVRDEVEKGAPLATALEQEPDSFDKVFCSMVAAGEATASLPAMFERLAVLAKQQLEVRNRVLGAMLYPAVLVTICTGVVTLLMLFVIPRFAGLFETLHVDLPTSTAKLMALSSFLRAHGVWAASTVAASMIGITLYLRSRSGRKAIGWVAIRLPAFGTLVRSLILARLCRLLGLMVEARVPLLEAVDLTLNGTKHLEYRELLKRVRDIVTEGQPLATALAESPLVPRSVVQAVAAGEQSGQVGQALIFVADWMDDENRQRVGSLSKLIEPIILVFMGVVVGGVAVSLFMPLFDMATAAAAG
jgi:type II secretory pathway component PulF